ncbi:MAG: NADH-quinone oxidoreductase subunit M [Pseudomonadota bacterium]
MATWPLLSVLIFLPLVGAVMIFFTGGDEEIAGRNARWVALWTTFVAFVLALLAWFSFEPSSADYQLVEDVEWLGGAISYTIGVDGISLLFVVLTTFLMPICVIASWDSVRTRVKEFMITVLFLETVLIGLFCSLDLVLFYVFFQASLFPAFILLSTWGGETRFHIAIKSFFFLFIGSGALLIAVATIYWQVGTTDLVAVEGHAFASDLQTWLWLAIFVAFAVAVPIWPFHTWMPDALEDGPSASAILITGILIKVGIFGSLRFLIPLFPVATEFFSPFVIGLSLVTVVYCALAAMAQENLRRLIAYFSVAQMGVVFLGVFSASLQGIQGGIVLALSHGVVFAALIVCVSMIVHRLRTDDMRELGGLASQMPVLAGLFLVFLVGSVGIPGTSGFVGTFLTIVGTFYANPAAAIGVGIGLVIAGGFSAGLYRRVFAGNLDKESVRSVLDLDAREVAGLTPLVLVTLFFGFYPAPILDVTAPSIEKLLETYQMAIEAHATGSSVAE